MSPIPRNHRREDLDLDVRDREQRAADERAEEQAWNDYIAEQERAELEWDTQQERMHG